MLVRTATATVALVLIFNALSLLSRHRKAFGGIGSLGAQSTAARGLPDLTPQLLFSYDEHTQLGTARAAGDIDTLVALVRSGSELAKAPAAWALATAAETADKNRAIVRAGAIEPLVALVGGDNAGAQVAAAAVLVNLAFDNADNRVAIVRAGAIEPLVALVRGGSAMAQEQAADALRNLASSAANQVAIAQEGAIGPLVAMMRDGSPRAQVEATTALCFLAVSNPENQAAIARAGAIGPLLALLWRGGKAESQTDCGPVELLDILAIDNKMAFMWWVFTSGWPLTPINVAAATYAAIYMVYSRWNARLRAKQVRRPEKDRRRRRQAGAAAEATQDKAQAETNKARAEVEAAKHKAAKAEANAMTAADKAAALAKANATAMIAAEKAAEAAKAAAAEKAAAKAVAAKASAEKAAAKAAAGKAAAEKATATAKAAAEKAAAERVVAAATAAVPLHRPPSLPVTSLAAAQFDTGRPAAPESTIGGQTTCIVCFVNPKTHAAVPCGHLCACGECSARLRECPVCRASGVSWFHVHLA